MQIPNRPNGQEGVAMASIYRRGTTGIYQVSWIDEKGLRRARSTRTTNRRAALQVAKDLIHQPQPSLQRLQLEELLVLWASELNALGRYPRYVRERVQTVRKIGLDVYKANLRLGDLAETGRSDRTVQVAYGALVQFGKWCLVNVHRDRDPLLGRREHRW